MGIFNWDIFDKENEASKRKTMLGVQKRNVKKEKEARLLLYRYLLSNGFVNINIPCYDRTRMLTHKVSAISDAKPTENLLGYQTAAARHPILQCQALEEK